MLRILIVDDHPIVREGLKLHLESRSGWKVVAEAEDSETAVARCADTDLDFAVVDLSLPGGSGLELIHRIRNRWENLKILVCSMHDEMISARRALDLGAQGYVQKHDASRLILHAVEVVARGGIYASPEVVERIVIHDRTSRRSTRGRSPINSLTAREYEVFEGIGGGLTIRELATELGLTVKTVETYRDRLRRKLFLDSSHDLSHFAIRWIIENAAPVPEPLHKQACRT